MGKQIPKRLLLMVLVTFISIYASASDFEKDGIYYEILSADEKTCEVTNNGTNSYSGDVAIPSEVTYDGVTYKVTGIGEYAFFFCTSLTSVNIPEGVTSIGMWAFKNSGLTSIKIPEGVTSIRVCAFEGCKSLTSIEIPEGVTSIENYTFQDCTSLTSVKLPNSLTRIDAYAFYGCI